MINTYKHNGLTWIDLESPTSEEVRKVMEEYNITPLIAEELLSPTLKPKVDLYEDYIYLILHFPALRHTHSVGKNQEVDFVIGKDFIITTRYDTIDSLHKFSKVFEVNSVLDKSDIGDHAGFIVFYMLRKLYKSLMHELEYIQDELDLVEESIFNGKEKEMVREISNIARALLDFKQSVLPHANVLSSFEVAGAKFFGEKFSHHLESISGEYFRVKNQIESEFESVKELRETNNSLLFTRQNETMKVLSIMAFVTFPLSLIATIFGMNTEQLPLVGHPNDFWIIMTIMASLTGVFFWYFKKKKWL